MSELSDYKRLVSDPHIADLKEIIARQAASSPSLLKRRAGLEQTGRRTRGR